jgi:hypothetical protein
MDEHEGSELMEMGYFELFRVMRLVPQGFHDQTDPRVRTAFAALRCSLYC